jgi:gliding motility-associated-like protein
LPAGAPLSLLFYTYGLWQSRCAKMSTGRMYRRLLLFAALFISGTSAWASHNLAGQITYTRIGTNQYEILLTTYTDPFAAGVDRCTANVEIWAVVGGDYTLVGELNDIPRENGPSGSCESPARMGVFVRPSIKRNYYRANFTFRGPGLYEIRYYDIARINNVSNMSNSGGTAFYVGTLLNNNPFIGQNNSPVLLNDPLDDACLFRTWTHNPGAYDPDGDSLSFDLIPNRQYEPPTFPEPVNVANYQFPGNFGGAFTIDATTGLVTWDAAEQVGVYNICIRVTEWRNGQNIGYLLRDMAIFVKPCQNDPPNIIAITDTCVQPGTQLVLPIAVEDPDFNDSVYFYLNNAGEGNNGPFQVPLGPATLTTNMGSTFPVRIAAPVSDFRAEFVWDVQCVHLRDQFYQVDLYAHDDIIHGSSPAWDETLSDNHIIKIRVRAAPVDSLTLTPGNKQITVDWAPNICPTAIGYEVWRSEGPSGFVPDSICCEGAPTGGYEKVAFVTGWNNTVYTDNDSGAGLEFRDVYCYRIVTVFPGDIRSCPSTEACVRIRRDFVLMTNDSIAATDALNGAAFVAWHTPDSIDPIFFPPPYTYELWRAEGSAALAPILTNLTQNDTTHLDAGLNTVNNTMRYQVKVYDANGVIVEQAQSSIASSIYLSTSPSHESITLSWTETVPWLNTAYEVYNVDTLTNAYTLLTTISANGEPTHSYKVTGLQNGFRYCFVVRSRGSYNVLDIKDPLINDSQRACDIPRDTVPPCTPSADSLAGMAIPDCETFTVRFRMERPTDTCALDLARYDLYYSRVIDGSYSPLHAFIFGPTDTLLEWTYTPGSVTGIAGCYRVTGTDSALNTSPFSEPFCLDNCPLFSLPNVITPNSDGFNDFWSAIDIRSVRSITFTLYDRWGTAIVNNATFPYPTDDTRLWDGTTTTGREAAAGVYFYVMDVELDNLLPITVQRSGSVTLLR